MEVKSIVAALKSRIDDLNKHEGQGPQTSKVEPAPSNKSFCKNNNEEADRQSKCSEISHKCKVYLSFEATIKELNTEV